MQSRKASQNIEVCILWNMRHTILPYADLYGYLQCALVACVKIENK